MRNLTLTFRDLPDKDGRPIPVDVQAMTYLIWTAPERRLTMRDYRKVFRRVTKMFGYKVGFWTTLKFTRNTPCVGWATRSWLRSEYYLDDKQIDYRQATVFRRGFRGTSFDKMERIRSRAYLMTEYKDMGPETCDREALFKEIMSMDLSGLLADEPVNQPPRSGRGGIHGCLA